MPGAMSTPLHALVVAAVEVGSVVGPTAVAADWQITNVSSTNSARTNLVRSDSLLVHRPRRSTRWQAVVSTSA